MLIFFPLKFADLGWKGNTEKVKPSGFGEHNKCPGAIKFLSCEQSKQWVLSTVCLGLPVGFSLFFLLQLAGKVGEVSAELRRLKWGEWGSVTWSSGFQNTKFLTFVFFFFPLPLGPNWMTWLMQFPKVRRTRGVNYTPWTHTNQNLWGKSMFNIHNLNILKKQSIETN